MTRLFSISVLFWCSWSGFAGTVYDFQTQQLQRTLTKFEGIYMKVSDLANEVSDPATVSLYRIAVVQDENLGPKLILDVWTSGRIERRFSGPLKDLPRYDINNPSDTTETASAGLNIIASHGMQRYGRSLRSEMRLQITEPSSVGMIMVTLLKQCKVVRASEIGGLQNIGAKIGRNLLVKPEILSSQNVSLKENRKISLYTFIDGNYPETAVDCPSRLTTSEP